MRLAFAVLVVIVCGCTQAQTPPIETQPPASSAATKPATTAPASPTEPTPLVEPANPATTPSTTPLETAQHPAPLPTPAPADPVVTTPPAPTPTPATPTPAPPEKSPAPPPSVEPVVAGQPLPAAPATSPVDTSCKVDSDCAVKNVGNCCGYYPRCVNKASPTYPEQVKAKCAAEGMASVCGFQEIASCTCDNGTCQGVSTPGGDSPM